MDHLGNFDEARRANGSAIAHRALERHAHRRAGVACTRCAHPVRILGNLSAKILARIHRHDQHAEALQVLRNDGGAGHDAEELHHESEP